MEQKSNALRTMLGISIGAVPVLQYANRLGVLEAFVTLFAFPLSFQLEVRFLWNLLIRVICPQVKTRLDGPMDP